MEYAKISSGALIIAPENLENNINCKSDPTLMDSLGYKPYTVDPLPDVGPDQTLEIAYKEDAVGIRKTWTLVLKNASLRATELRRQRDQLLAKSDFYLMADYPLSPEHRAAVIAYRQALRDLPATATWPFKICFPSLTL